MEATEILMQEHRLIDRVLTTLEAGAARVDAGQPMRPGFFIEATDFVKGFADGCHHRKEEGVLFTAMVDSGLPRESGPIAVMLAEHEEGRVYTRGLRALPRSGWKPVMLRPRRGNGQRPRLYGVAARAHLQGRQYPLPDGRPSHSEAARRK